MKRAAFAFTALASYCTPALAYANPVPPPLANQFLISIALMAMASAVVVWESAALARKRKRLRSAQI
jgi:hypothetical protein